MLNEHFVAEQVARVEDYLGDLAAIPDRERNLSEDRVGRFAEHTLQLAIQRCCDVAVHVANDLCGTAVHEDLPPKPAVDKLVEVGWIDEDLKRGMLTLIDLRNVIVHRVRQPRGPLDHWLSSPPGQGDAEVARLVAEAIRSRLDHLRGFVAAMQGRLRDPWAARIGGDDERGIGPRR